MGDPLFLLCPELKCRDWVSSTVYTWSPAPTLPHACLGSEGANAFLHSTREQSEAQCAHSTWTQPRRRYRRFQVAEPGEHSQSHTREPQAS